MRSPLSQSARLVSSVPSAPAVAARPKTTAVTRRPRISVEAFHVALVEVLLGQVAQRDLAVVEERRLVGPDRIDQCQPSGEDVATHLLEVLEEARLQERASARVELRLDRASPLLRHPVLDG